MNDINVGHVNLKTDIDKATACLVGLNVCHLAYAGNVRGIHFGRARELGGRLVGEYALHLQCPWRLEANGRIATGFQDYYTPATNNHEEGWEPKGARGSLQEEVLAKMFNIPIIRSVPLSDVYHGGRTVKMTRGDSFGGLVIVFTGRLRLRVFPAASTEEHWRLFQPKRRTRHFVVNGSTAFYE